MIDIYFPVLVLFVLATGFTVAMLLISNFLGPRTTSEMKEDPFECGTVGTGNSCSRFGVGFYIVAMLFILFDIEIVFLYPWAVNAIVLGWYAYFVMLSFISVLVIGLAYVWRCGALDWS